MVSFKLVYPLITTYLEALLYMGHEMACFFVIVCSMSYMRINKKAGNLEKKRKSYCIAKESSKDSTK